MSQDPRRPSSVKPLLTAQLPKEESGDLWTFFAMLLSMGGMMLRWRVLSWGSLFCLCTSFANAKTTEQWDLRQLFPTLIFTGVSLFMNYFGPQAHLAR